MNIRQKSSNVQQGFMLLEALIAILIFSIGILAIIGLQAASVRMSGDAKYRSDANMLINKIIAQMWVSDHDPVQLQSNFDTSSNSGTYQAWASEVNNTLPGVSSVPGNLPSITVVPVSGTNPNVPTSLVTVRVNWTLPGEATGTRHTSMSIAQIR